MPAAAPDGGTQLRRSRRSIIDRGHRYEYLEPEIDSGTERVTPLAHHYAPSEQGAGALGFAGAVGKNSGVQAAGLATLAPDEFGNGPTMPMVPGTWDDRQT